MARMLGLPAASGTTKSRTLPPKRSSYGLMPPFPESRGAIEQRPNNVG
jgi:hypothetical protein